MAGPGGWRKKREGAAALGMSGRNDDGDGEEKARVDGRSEEKERVDGDGEEKERVDRVGAGALALETIVGWKGCFYGRFFCWQEREGGASRGGQILAMTDCQATVLRTF